MINGLNTGSLEIERKFLLRRPPIEVLNASYKRERNTVFYRWDENIKLWVRATHIIVFENEESTILYVEAIKKWISPGVCDEKERFLTHAEFIQHTILSTKTIQKTRHFYKSGSAIWEIDVYENLKLCVAELEVKSMEDSFEIPTCIQNELIMEVTQFKEFSNVSLAVPI